MYLQLHGSHFGLCRSQAKQWFFYTPERPIIVVAITVGQQYPGSNGHGQHPCNGGRRSHLLEEGQGRHRSRPRPGDGRCFGGSYRYRSGHVGPGCLGRLRRHVWEQCRFGLSSAEPRGIKPASPISGLSLCPHSTSHQFATTGSSSLGRGLLGVIGLIKRWSGRLVGSGSSGQFSSLSSRGGERIVVAVAAGQAKLEGSR